MSVGPAFASGLFAANLSVQALERTLGMPPDGPKCVPMTLDFTAKDFYSLDYSQQGALGKFSMVQTLFIDTSTSAVNLTVDCPTSQQTLKIKAGTQGYYPILCPNPIRLIFTCVGGPADVKVELLNFPVPHGQWAV